MSRTKELTKNTIIITIGRVSTQLITFLLLPLYTTLLTTEEYGTVDLVTTLVQLFIPIVSLMIDQGVFRYLLNCISEEEKEKTISSAFFFLLAISVVIAVLYAVICIFVVNEYKLWLILILIAMAFSNLFLQIARGLKHTSDYALGSFICSASTIVLNVLCIAFLNMGAKGMLMATFVGNAICCLFLFLKLGVRKYISIFAINKSVVKDELKYSVPLVPNQLSLWVMNSSDRIIVTFFLGAAANGILAVSHKFPAIYMTFFNIFQLAWHESGAIHYFDEDRDQFFTDMVKKIIGIFSTLCMGVIVVLPLVFKWFVHSSYSEAYYNIPIYLVASLFNVIIGLLGVVYVATKRTKEIAKTTIFSAVINLVVNICLIKYFGLYAASISTFVGYFFTMIYRVIDTKKYLKIRYDIKQILGLTISLILCCTIYYLDNKMALMIFLPIFVGIAYFINKDIVDNLLEMLSKKLCIGTRKIKMITVCGFVLIIIIVGHIAYKGVFEHPKEIQTAYKGKIVTLMPEKVISFADIDLEDFICTGLTYDSKDNTFWIGNYGAMNPDDQARPRLVEVEIDIQKVIREIDLSDIVDSSVNLQGVAYDSARDCLWLAVGKNIVGVDKNGTLIKTVEMGEYAECMANGVCYDESDDSLWVLCASQYLLHFKTDGTLLTEFSFNYAYQDHICMDGDYLYVTIGADYQGDDNFVCKVSMEDGSIISLFRMKQANALEGICIVGDRMLIANDGLYHSDLIGHSYISAYNFDEIR